MIHGHAHAVQVAVLVLLFTAVAGKVAYDIFKAMERRYWKTHCSNPSCRRRLSGNHFYIREDGTKFCSSRCRAQAKLRNSAVKLGISRQRGNPA